MGIRVSLRNSSSGTSTGPNGPGRRSRAFAFGIDVADVLVRDDADDLVALHRRQQRAQAAGRVRQRDGRADLVGEHGRGVGLELRILDRVELLIAGAHRQVPRLGVVLGKLHAVEPVRISDAEAPRREVGLIATRSGLVRRWRRSPSSRGRRAGRPRDTRGNRAAGRCSETLRRRPSGSATRRRSRCATSRDSRRAARRESGTRRRRDRSAATMQSGSPSTLPPIANAPCCRIWIAEASVLRAAATCGERRRRTERTREQRREDGCSYSCADHTAGRGDRSIWTQKGDGFIFRALRRSKGRSSARKINPSPFHRGVSLPRRMPEVAVGAARPSRPGLGSRRAAREP